MPKYGFPVDVVELKLLHHGEEARRLELERDLRIAIAEYAPALVKKTVVGRGAALKPQVAYMVAKLLKLRQAPAPADAADAVAVALTHLLTRFPRGNGGGRR